MEEVRSGWESEERETVKWRREWRSERVCESGNRAGQKKEG